MRGWYERVGERVCERVGERVRERGCLKGYVLVDV